MNAFDKLIEIFRKFPGIGPRQAKRFAYHVLSLRNEEVSTFSEIVAKVREDIASCSLCNRYFDKKKGGAHIANTSGLCNICRDAERDHNLLMIIPTDTELQSVERMGIWKGLYYVLGGTISLTDEVPESHILYKKLGEYIANRMNDKKPFTEIVIATSYNPEGEHTSLFLRSLIKEITEKSGGNSDAGKSTKVSTLGRGFSTGTEIEYSDTDTFKSALQNRVVR